MGLFKNDTIVALTTAPLPAGVAVIRLSGNKALSYACALSPSFNQSSSGYMTFSILKDSVTGAFLDKCLMVYFKSPKSFTGEDVVEIHCHGGKAVIDGILSALYHLGARPADPGEFSKRAFLNGKMDLTAAEGIMDIVAAETEAQRLQALSQMDGTLGEYFETWRTQILNILAHVEAAIDFPDEELDVIESSGLVEKVTTLLNLLDEAASNNLGERVRDGFSLAILGKPNAGKSSLTNLLTGKDTAIVSPIEGTTRDIVEATINLEGFPLILADTAGLRDTVDEIEKEGVRRAKHKGQLADLRVIVIDASDWPHVDETVAECIQPGKTVFLLSKIDLIENKISFWQEHLVENKVIYKGIDYPGLAVNLQKKENFSEIAALFKDVLENQYALNRQSALLTRERHKVAVRDAATALRRTLEIINSHGLQHSISELIAEDLREAAKHIGNVTGRTETEDVLDVVFSSFCIGK